MAMRNNDVVPAVPLHALHIKTLPNVLGSTVQQEYNARSGVLTPCPAVQVAIPQPDWYMPGYRSIQKRLCDGQWVTCGNGYPCADPTPKQMAMADNNTYYSYGWLPNADASPSWERY